MGILFEENESQAENLIAPLDDQELIKLTIESFINMQEEEEVTKKGIMLMIDCLLYTSDAADE